MALLLSNDMWVEICDFIGLGIYGYHNALTRVCRNLWRLLDKRHETLAWRHLRRRHGGMALIHRWVKWCGNQVSSFLKTPIGTPESLVIA